MSATHDLLLHPDFLSNEQLVLIIQERRLLIPNIGDKSRDELLHTVHQYCVPLGQRKPREKLQYRTRHVKTNGAFAPSGPFEAPGEIEKIKIESKALFVYDNHYNLAKRKADTDVMIAATDDSPPVKREKKPITWP